MPVHGFTLLELIVVLTLMSIVLAVTAPRLAGRNQAAALQGVGDDVLSLSGAARARAVMAGQSVGLLFDGGGTTLRLVTVQSIQKRKRFTDLVAPRALTPGYRVTLQRQVRQSGNTAGNLLYFRPDGSADSGELQIMAPTGEALRFRVIESLGQWRRLPR